MKIFISWSGEPSKSIAEALYNWLPDVIQEAEPFYSAESLDVGSRWLSELEDELKGSIGIICLTRNNLTAPWLHYEAGALSKAVPDATVRVIPLLYGLEPRDVRPPLSQFNMTQLTAEGLRKIVKTLNGLADRSLDVQRLEGSFRRCWPELEATLSSLPKATEDAPPDRKAEEVLDEILEVVRDLQRFMRTGRGEVLFDASLLAALTAGTRESRQQAPIDAPLGSILDHRRRQRASERAAELALADIFRAHAHEVTHEESAESDPDKVTREEGHDA